MVADARRARTQYRGMSRKLLVAKYVADALTQAIPLTHARTNLPVTRVELDAELFGSSFFRETRYEFWRNMRHLIH